MTWLGTIPLQRAPQVPSLTELTWSCMVCDDERPDVRVSVVYRRPAVFEGRDLDPRIEARCNVRYCNDRATCTSVVRRTEVWPPTVPVFQADQVLQLTPAALADRGWETRDLNELATGILTWLRDEPDAIQTLLNSYDQPAQAIFDTCRALVGMGMVEVVS